MEPVSLGFTAVGGLVTIFDTCVNTFEHIQLAHHFGEDFGTAMLQLASRRLRLVRWGASIGLAGLKPEDAIPAALGENTQFVKDTLELMERQFRRCKTMSEKYRSKLTLKTDLGLCDSASELQKPFKHAFLSMNKLVNNRQKQTPVVMEPKWAFYEKKECDKLITNITGLIIDLEEHYSGDIVVEANQQALVKEDASILVTDTPDGAAALRNALDDGDDDLLKAALSERLQASGSIENISTGLRVKAYGRRQIGERNMKYTGQSVRNIAVDTVAHSFSDVHIGNSWA